MKLNSGQSFLAGILVALAIVALSACTAQKRTSYGDNMSMGPVPSDICLVNGVPQVISVSVENEGDIDFAYHAINGDIVNQKYGLGFIGVTTNKQGSLRWTGGRPCPPG